MKNFLTRLWSAARSQDIKLRETGSSTLLNRTTAGIYVDELRALRLATVWACVRVISESIACLPWQVFRKERSGKRTPFETHPAAWLLGVQANPETSAFSFKEVLTACAALYGDGYAEIERDQAGRPVWLWQREPWRVCPERDDSGRLQYRIKNQSQADTIIPAEDMFHLHGPSLDGITGLNPIHFGADSIALALAMEQFGSAFFGNGSNPSGVFETDVNMGKDAIENFKDQYKKAHVGPRNAKKDLVLPKGMKWKQISVQPEESQFNDSRYQQVEEIARRYRVPPHKIGHLLRSTNNNIEHQAIEFVQDCLLPWCVRLEQEANIKLFGRAMSGVAYTKLNLMSQLRGDSAAQSTAFKTGRDGGWLSVNDIRRLLDMDPIGPEGDVYLVPGNMVAADQFEKFSEKQAQNPKPAKAAPEPGTPEPDEDDEGEEPEEDDSPQARRRRLDARYAHMLKVVEGNRNA